MRFKYHMYGDDIGTLSIYRQDSLFWEEEGNHGNQWVETSVDFDCSVPKYQVRERQRISYVAILTEYISYFLVHVFTCIPLRADKSVAFCREVLSNCVLSHRYRDLRTDFTVNKSRTTFISSEISSFALLIGRTTFFH